jgi:hypothetical protein
MTENMGIPPVEGEPKKNNRTLIIVIVALVVLCCCCVAIASSVWLWNNGDALLYNLGI